MITGSKIWWGLQIKFAAIEIENSLPFEFKMSAFNILSKVSEFDDLFAQIWIHIWSVLFPSSP